MVQWLWNDNIFDVFIRARALPNTIFLGFWAPMAVVHNQIFCATGGRGSPCLLMFMLVRLIPVSHRTCKVQTCAVKPIHCVCACAAREWTSLHRANVQLGRSVCGLPGGECSANRILCEQALNVYSHHLSDVGSPCCRLLTFNGLSGVNYVMIRPLFLWCSLPAGASVSSLQFPLAGKLFATAIGYSDNNLLSRESPKICGDSAVTYTKNIWSITF